MRHHPLFCDRCAARDMAIRAISRAVYDHARGEPHLRDFEMGYATLMLNTARDMLHARDAAPIRTPMSPRG